MYRSLASLLVGALSLLDFASAQYTMSFGTQVITVSGTSDGSDGTQCPGILSITGPSSTDGYCCVGGYDSPSTCDGWPFCTGTSTEATSTSTPSCAASIPLTASDYSDLISSASSSYFGGASSGSQPTTTTSASATGSSSSSSTSHSSISTSTESSASSSTTASSAGTGSILVPAGALGGSLLALAIML